MYPHDLDLVALENDLIRDEGFRAKPYRDTTGHLTIGYGHNLDAKGITERQGRMLLRDDMVEVLTGLKQRLPMWEPLDGVRKRVLANLAFNLGVDKLLDQFRPTLHLIADGDYQEAADHLRASLWASQVRDRATRLIRMMERGE